MSTAFHLRTDGARKRANQWLEQYLRIWTADNQTTWAQFLSLAEFVHNSWPHDRTTLTPHELLFGTKPPFPLSDEEAETPDITTRLRQIREAQDKAEEALQISKECSIPVNFEEGEQVWLEGHNLKTHHPMAKLAPYRYGPFLLRPSTRHSRHRFSVSRAFGEDRDTQWSSLLLCCTRAGPRHQAWL